MGDEIVPVAVEADGGDWMGGVKDEFRFDEKGVREGTERGGGFER